MKDTPLKLIEELRGIAQLGLNYSKDVHDRARYERLLEIVSSEYGTLTDVPSYKIHERLREELGHITPKVGVNGALFSSDRKLFLTRRADDKTWEMPGGWADLNESPRQALAREFLEETSLTVQVEALLEVVHRLPGDFGQPHTSYHLLFMCRAETLNPSLSAEVTDWGFFDRAAKLEWHRDHRKMFEVAMAICEDNQAQHGYAYQSDR